MKGLDSAIADRRKAFSVIVVGAGVTGVAVSRYLSANAIDHLVLERAHGVGGIWRTERWPGVRCDTEIISYSYSFNPMIADVPLLSGAAILGYLQDVAESCGITANILFGVTVTKATFDNDQAQWLVETTRGTFAAKFLVNANGYFADAPYIPAFDGVNDFCGGVIHLSQFSDADKLAGRRVILVGSGASAISAASALCDRGASVLLLQRSPSYIFEDPNKLDWLTRLAQRAYTRGIRWPVALVRFRNRLKNDSIFVLFRKFPWLGMMYFRCHWRGAVDPESLDEGFCPRYGPWEQRIPVAVGLKNSFASGKLRIATGEIARFTKSGVKLKDGRSYDADICILATGRDLDLFKFALLLGDKEIDARGLNFYKGMMLGGVPNYFHPFGVVHATWTQRIERVAKLITRIIGHMRKHCLDTVMVERRSVRQTPRITPNYIMRNLSGLPAIYGTLEIPSIDNLFCLSFRRRDFCFGKKGVAADSEQQASSSAINEHAPVVRASSD